MPSVGSLLITLKAETEGMRADLDKAKGKLREFETSAAQSGKGASQGMDIFGDRTRLMAGKVAAAGMLLGTTFKKFSGDADNAFTKVLEGGSKVAAGFALGGPPGAAVVALVEVVGLFAEEAQKAAEASKAWADELQKVNEGITKGLGDELKGTVARLKELTESGRSPLEKIAREADDARRALSYLEDVRDAAGVRLGDMKSSTEIDSTSKANFDNLSSMYARIVVLRDLIRALGGEERHVAIDKEVASLHDENEVLSLTASLEGQLAGTRSNITSATTKLLELERERNLLARDTTDKGKDALEALDKQIERQKQVLAITERFNAESANREISQQIADLGKIPGFESGASAYQKQIETWTRDGANAGLLEAFHRAVAMRPMLELAGSLASSIGSSVSEALYDAIVNGGRGAANILGDLLRTMLRTLLNSIVNSGLTAILGALGGGGGGIAGIVTAIAGGVGGVASGGGGGSVVSDIAPILGGGAGCEGGT